MVKQLPLRINAAHKSDVRSQFAALCYKKVKGKIKILLITSRRSGRWVVPKGWPMDRKTPANSAAQEAWEEAGVIGEPVERCLGVFAYSKTAQHLDELPCMVMVYPVKVKKLATDFPEKSQRRRKWFSPDKAAAKVAEPELARILRDFDPRVLR